MKVIIALNTAWNLVNFRAGLIRALVAEGHEVVAVAPNDEYAPRLAELGCRFVALPMDNKGTHPGRDLLLWFRFLNLLRRERPDVFLGYTIKPNVYGSLAAHVSGIPVVNNIAGLGAVFIRDNWLTRLVRLLYKTALSRSHHVFFQNDEDCRMFVESGLVAADKVSRLPGSGVDLVQFSPADTLPMILSTICEQAPSPASGGRSQSLTIPDIPTSYCYTQVHGAQFGRTTDAGGHSPNPPDGTASHSTRPSNVNGQVAGHPASGRGEFRFLLVARLLWDKGVGEFVEAARMVHRQYPTAKFQLLGFLDVKNPTAVSSVQMDDWVEEGVVEYLGVADDVKPYLAAADCVVLPSYREGVPRSLLEAAAMGRPIVTTDAVGCRDAVDDGVNGLLCRVGDAGDLADKLLRMIEMFPEERALMGLEGRKKMEREFDEKIVIRRYLEIIGEVSSPAASANY